MYMDLTQEEMTELLAHGDVAITISAGAEQEKGDGVSVHAVISQGDAL